MVKLCHEKMRNEKTLRCTYPFKKTEPPPEKNLTSHPPKILNTLWKNISLPPPKIPIYKKNSIPCKNFNHPENLNHHEKSLTPSENFSTPLK